ncbi:hypothetical protein CDAR_496311 [Caerostris darwini]|uniref:Uncharacterized protein n=1 Tax=Caerostris darwini TaxID=1538125 RepID=A0AAV4MU86_9ARAC|nr:hypothetical protein CDAR_496311 [Caerostris darwini]
MIRFAQNEIRPPNNPRGEWGWIMREDGTSPCPRPGGTVNKERQTADAVLQFIREQSNTQPTPDLISPQQKAFKNQPSHKEAPTTPFVPHSLPNSFFAISL